MLSNGLKKMIPILDIKGCYQNQEVEK